MPGYSVGRYEAYQRWLAIPGNRERKRELKRLRSERRKSEGLVGWN